MAAVLLTRVNEKFENETSLELSVCAVPVAPSVMVMIPPVFLIVVGFVEATVVVRTIVLLEVPRAGLVIPEASLTTEVTRVTAKRTFCSSTIEARSLLLTVNAVEARSTILPIIIPTNAV